MIKPFHKLRIEEIRWLIKEGNTFAELEKDFPQPAWCNYPQAVFGVMGCWSLMSGMISGKEACTDCDCYDRS